jgi:hypothetical protein
MMKKCIFVGLFLGLVGCTKSNPVGCAIQDSVVSLVSSGIVTQLACKNLDAVKASIQAEVEKAKLCVQPAPAPALATAAKDPNLKGPIGNVICGPVIDALTGGILAQIPSAWSCTGGVPADQLKAFLLAQCQKAI